MKIGGVLWLALAGAAMASPITFTISANGSGTLNGVPFTDVSVTFTQVTDTSLIVANCLATTGLYCAPASASNTVTIGSSTYTLTDLTQFVDNTNDGFTGILDFTTLEDMISQNDPAFLTYHLETSIGPLVDSDVQPGASLDPTSGGELQVVYNSSAFFTATTTSAPEPGTLGLILAGAMLFIRRKSKR